MGDVLAVRENLLQRLRAPRETTSFSTVENSACRRTECFARSSRRVIGWNIGNSPRWSRWLLDWRYGNRPQRQQRQSRRSNIRSSFVKDRFQVLTTESRVRISWGGTSNVTGRETERFSWSFSGASSGLPVLRSTFIIESTHGNTKNRPGPLAPPRLRNSQRKCRSARSSPTWHNSTETHDHCSFVFLDNLVQREVCRQLIVRGPLNLPWQWRRAKTGMLTQR